MCQDDQENKVNIVNIVIELLELLVYMNNIQELLESTTADDLKTNALCVVKFWLLGRTWMLT